MTVRTAKPLDPARIKTWPHVTSCEFRDPGWLLGTSDLNRTIISLVKELETEGNELLDLQIQRPSLEDAFIELTGRPWVPPPPESD